jgi:hypothetical protein
LRFLSNFLARTAPISVEQHRASVVRARWKEAEHLDDHQLQSVRYAYRHSYQNKDGFVVIAMPCSHTGAALRRALVARKIDDSTIVLTRLGEEIRAVLNGQPVPVSIPESRVANIVEAEWNDEERLDFWNDPRLWDRTPMEKGRHLNCWDYLPDQAKLRAERLERDRIAQEKLAAEMETLRLRKEEQEREIAAQIALEQRVREEKLRAERQALERKARENLRQAEIELEKMRAEMIEAERKAKKFKTAKVYRMKLDPLPCGCSEETPIKRHRDFGGYLVSQCLSCDSFWEAPSNDSTGRKLAKGERVACNSLPRGEQDFG